MTFDEKMKRKEELRKEIEELTDDIKFELSLNPDNGTVSFLQWQRYCAEKKLEELDKENVED